MEKRVEVVEGDVKSARALDAVHAHVGLLDVARLETWAVAVADQAVRA
jgi:hypothetical protein